MRYKILLFDLDGTILDFDASEDMALRELFASKGVLFTAELKEAYLSVNNGLWRKYEKGIITMQQLLDTRFRETLERFGMNIDGAAWEKEYRERLGTYAFMIDGAENVIKALSESYRLFAVTNGVGDTQISRLKIAGIYDCFENVYVSQLIGAQKPSKAFFDYVAADIEGYEVSDTLIIGDSPITDIGGGRNAGIDTCFFNPTGRKYDEDVLCTYEIRQLEELYDICK
ncbi:MAG: YjjG family noncanonical pyrimidine nucleotidase [Clostridia bacterium]|nr:YjjG family noncanonical pyrimidine nucleotidase [Clostridia bacterium]